MTLLSDVMQTILDMNVWASPLVQVLLGIFVLLIIASIVNGLLKRSKPEKNFSEIGDRIRSWWFMAIVFSIATLIHENISLVFFAFLTYLALKEYFSMVPTRRADRKVLFFAYLSIPIQFLWIYMEWYGMFIIFIPIYMFLFLPIVMVFIGQTKGFLKSIGAIHWGIMLMVFGLSHLAYFLALPEAMNPLAGGAGFIIYLVILTQLNDVSQFLFGKMFGKRKIVPAVSPNKTWAGFLGGIGVTVLLALLLAPLLTPFTWVAAIGSGVLISIFGFIGDVNISALKRDIGIKDSGKALPGHGGILDRIDSLTYTAPLFFHFTNFF
ncbi:phosphatidate cytidylyltransferase [Salicibibacter cibi]|nr:phosphatidate cytidylyltransferase [Salicibibacter cibi]